MKDTRRTACGRIASESGGATALYHKFQDIEMVKRYGRWASSAFHVYLWEANEQAKGVAKAMAEDTTTLHVGYRLGDKQQNAEEKDSRPKCGERPGSTSPGNEKRKREDRREESQ